jgi:DNA mismatch repair protein MutL
MGRIRVLDDLLVNRIAAGEVVERPASVVKELVENALDAGATMIDVELASGGRGRIAVVDDGVGMDRDDCLLALERHATSKIAKGDRLDAIRTLGFRGEALPSIASVSRLRLRSATRHGEGSEIEVHGGRVQAVRDVAAPRGTSVEVEALFFNVPARRKFLRSESTELARCTRVVTHYALAFPGIGFRLRHADRVLVDAPPAPDRDERVAQIHGREFARGLLPFDLERDGFRARGFAGRPVDALGTRDAQHLFVNGRQVQDRVLLHAISEAYGDTMPRGRFPAVLLFLDVPFDRVDVNVHPQKTEVRFVRSSEIHDFVRTAVASALSHVRAVPTLAELREPDSSSGIAAALLGYLDERAGYAPVVAPDPSPDPCAPAPPRLLVEAGLETARAIPLTQFRESYIVAQDAQGLLLVDQHVAHERVLYERYLAQAEADAVEVQRLLFPRTLDLAPDAMLVFEEECGELSRLGFLAERFGPASVRLDGVPAFAGEADPERLFRTLLGEAATVRSAAVREPELRRRLVTTAACQAAIKVNYPLSRDSMQRLLDDLFRTENPTTCPHGRPILFRLTLETIERAFQRR